VQVTPPRGSHRWAGFHIVIDPHGEPMRDCLRVLPDEARLCAAAQLGATWADLEHHGYLLQAIDIWSAPPP